MTDTTLSQPIVDVGWLMTFTIHGLILVLLGWMLIIRRLRASTDRRRQQMVAVWRPILAQSLIEAPDALPPIHPRDRVLFLYLWNHLQESIKGESSDELCAVIRRTGMDHVVRQYLAKGTLRQQLLAIVTLGHLKDLTIWPRLVDLAHDANAFRSLEAARALVRIDAPRAIPVLVPLISQRADWSPLKILAILKGAGDEQVAQALGEAAVIAEPRIAARLIRFLPSIKSHRALPLIRPLLTRQPLHEDVLASCLVLFGQCSDPRDLPIVRQYSAHSTWFIRVQAATALGKMGVEEDAAILIGLLNDEHWWVRYRAAEALSVMPTMTDDKLALLVQTLPPGEERRILTPFVAKRFEAPLAHTPGLSAA
ncbi:HEAT repeat domain-containing protein [Nitrospira lenta]|uniref:Putative Heat repeat protein n=1 Tax=Nitrospira lenta TaxID=1436998 RepID=A0A330L7I2_9BACT|nr:HEAT repeat domain-containing protein [Nitrospira lenta]SPP64945.1 putative Heat repeat protein [Nitrospira lenta]